MTAAVCSCGNWSGNHDPDCVVATTIHAIWAVSFSDNKKITSPPKWNRDIETILADNAHRVATALGDGADLPTEAQIVKVGEWLMEHRGWDTADVDELSEGFNAWRALAASTGTETDQ